MDEIFIKSNLVYDKHDGSLTGFVNIGNIKTQILAFENMIKSGGVANPSLESTMMMFMLRGLLHKFDYPYTLSACGKGMTGDLIFDPIWEATAQLDFLCWLYAVTELPLIGNCVNNTVKIMSCFIEYPMFMLQRTTGFYTLFQTLHIF